MKFGVKIYHEKEISDHFCDLADFLEVMAIKGGDYNFMECYSVPLVIHAQHTGFGVNLADRNLRKVNMRSLGFASELADKYQSQKIIVHPGKLENENCSEEECLGNISEFDYRVLVENMSEGFMGDSPKSIDRIMRMTSKGFCFDINHAISSAIAKKVDYIGFIKEFIDLGPEHYHIGGQILNNGSSKTHLHLEESNIPLEEIMSMIPKKAEITLETKPSIPGIEKDLKFARSFN